MPLFVGVCLSQWEWTTGELPQSPMLDEIQFEMRSVQIEESIHANQRKLDALHGLPSPARPYYFHPQP